MHLFVSDIAVFVLKRDFKLQPSVLHLQRSAQKADSYILDTALSTAIMARTEVHIGSVPNPLRSPKINNIGNV